MMAACDKLENWLIGNLRNSCGERNIDRILSIYEILSQKNLHCVQNTKCHHLSWISPFKHWFQRSWPFWACRLLLSWPELLVVQAISGINNMQEQTDCSNSLASEVKLGSNVGARNAQHIQWRYFCDYISNIDRIFRLPWYSWGMGLLSLVVETSTGVWTCYSTRCRL